MLALVLCLASATVADAKLSSSAAEQAKRMVEVELQTLRPTKIEPRNRGEERRQKLPFPLKILRFMILPL